MLKNKIETHYVQCFKQHKTFPETLCSVSFSRLADSHGPPNPPLVSIFGTISAHQFSHWSFQ